MPSGSIPHGQERPNTAKRHAIRTSEEDSYDLALARRVTSRHAVIPHSAIVDRKLSDRQFRVYAMMCLHANTDDEAWPRQDTLATLMGVSQQYISRVVCELAELGYVEIRRMGFPARNHYFVPVKPRTKGQEIQEIQGNAAEISTAIAENITVTTTRVVTARTQLQPPEVVPVTTSGGCAKNSVYEQCSSVSQDSYLSTSLALRAENAAPTPASVTAPPERRTRERLDESALRRDELFVALAACLGCEPMTPREWWQWRTALNNLHAAHATAADIPRAIRGYQAAFPRAKVTPLGLVNNWSLIWKGKTHDLAQLEVAQRATRVATDEQRQRDNAGAEQREAQQREVERLLRELDDELRES